MGRDEILKLLESLFGEKFDALQEYLEKLTDKKLDEFRKQMEKGAGPAGARTTESVDGRFSRALQELKVGLNESDKYELAFLRLLSGKTKFDELTADKVDAGYHGVRAIESFVNAGKPRLPEAMRLSEWFYDYCGGIDAALNGEMRNARILEAAGTTSTLTSIVKNTVNILMANDYAKRSQWWEPIVRQEDVDTLDEATLVRAMGVNTLSEVPEGTTYGELAVVDEEETATYVKRGNYIGITLETFLTDKLAYLKSIPTRLSIAHYNTISKMVAGVFTVNTLTGPVLVDTGALFNATALGTPSGHANLLTTALSYASLGAARLAMMKQTDQILGAGEKLLITPKYVLVPADLEQVAKQIQISELVPGQIGGHTTVGEFQTVNTLKGEFTPVRSVLGRSL